MLPELQHYLHTVTEYINSSHNNRVSGCLQALLDEWMTYMFLLCPPLLALNFNCQLGKIIDMNEFVEIARMIVKVLVNMG